MCTENRKGLGLWLTEVQLESGIAYEVQYLHDAHAKHPRSTLPRMWRDVSKSRVLWVWIGKWHHRTSQAHTFFKHVCLLTKLTLAGAALLIGQYYKRNEFAIRFAWFICFALARNCFSGICCSTTFNWIKLIVYSFWLSLSEIWMVPGVLRAGDGKSSG
jgi:hypothetical protein